MTEPKDLTISLKSVCLSMSLDLWKGTKWYHLPVQHAIFCQINTLRKYHSFLCEQGLALNTLFQPKVCYLGNDRKNTFPEGIEECI